MLQMHTMLHSKTLRLDLYVELFEADPRVDPVKVGWDGHSIVGECDGRS